MNRYAAFFMVVLAAAALAACSSDKLTGTHIANQPPTVWLSAAPPEGSTGTYTVHLYWGGWDPDGEIKRYEYLVTDNVSGVFDPADTTHVQWKPVFANDSTFTFSADVLVDTTTTQQVTEFTRSHTFFIRSVDNQGQRSQRPAYRSFTSRTLSPRVVVSIPARNGYNPAEMPPIATFRWSATDYVNDDQRRRIRIRCSSLSSAQRRLEATSSRPSTFSAPTGRHRRGIHGSITGRPKTADASGQRPRRSSAPTSSRFAPRTKPAR